MKSKKNIYILLPVVLGIWGLLIYRFFSFASPDILPETNTNYTLRPISLKPKDTVRIDVNYRDPFLGKVYGPATAKTKPVGSLKAPRPAKAEIQWPSIVYKGIVSDVKDKKKVFMVLINGRTFLMREKEVQEDVTLIKGNNSEITVKHKGRQNLISLQK